MNKKLNLDIDALVVETFETQEINGGRGTVRAHGATDTCGQRVCTTVPTGGGVTCNSCQVTCLDTCEESCNTCEFTCDTVTGLSDCNSPFSICVCTPNATCIGESC